MKLVPEMDEVVASAARVFQATPAFLRRQRDIWADYWNQRVSKVLGQRAADSPREGASEKEAR